MATEEEDRFCDVRPKTVQEALDTNVLLDHYAQCYEDRYRVKPVILNASVASTILKDVARTVGMTLAMKLITKYLKMDGDDHKSTWFLRKGHDLQTFKENVSSINASLGSQEKKETKRGEHSLIMVSSVCPKCEASFQLTLSACDLETKVHLTECEKCGSGNKEEYF